MASFVPYYQKKLLILEGREDKLRRLLANRADESKLLKAAEVVRDARIRAARAKRSQIPPNDTPLRTQRIAKVDAEIELLSATTPKAILIEFRSKLESSA